MWTIRKIRQIFPKWIAWFFIALDVVWEAPQLLFGALIKIVFFAWGSREVETIRHGTCRIHNWLLYSGISLGWFQFTHKDSSVTTASHEVGHSIESLILGWFYLIVIGLPSMVHAIIWTACGKKWDYYSFYTESITDKLAGIVRN